MVTLLTHPKTEMTSHLKFEPGWHEIQSAPIYQGGKLVIEYNPVRLPVCRSNGPLDFPSWGIDVFVKFHPDGKLHQGKVTHSAETELDVELIGWIKPVPFEIEVPEDATFVEIWFNNSDYSNCSTWDSRYGQNYTYPVYSCKD